MNKFLITTVLLFSGCAFSNAPTPIDTKPPLNLRPAEPLKMRPVKLHVIHMGIAQKKFKDIEKSGEKPVVFALTGTDYKNLAINIQRLKSYIKTQQKIINTYKAYYEGSNNGNKK